MVVTIRIRRARINKLLSRREILLDVYHEGLPNVSQANLKDEINRKFGYDPKNIVLFGFRTAFGGNRSTGFVLAYNSHTDLATYEPTHRLRRLNIVGKKNPKRKSCKEMKRKLKRSRGAEKRKVLATRKIETRAQINKARSDYLKKILA